MDKKSIWAWILAALKGLPLIRYALMLGGGVVASLGVANAFFWLGYHNKFPDAEAVWLARIQGVVWLGLAFCAIIFVVMITLAWGKVNGVSASVGAASFNLDFDDDDEGDGNGKGSRVGSGGRGSAGGGWAGGDPDAGGHEPQQGRRRRRG